MAITFWIQVLQEIIEKIKLEKPAITYSEQTNGLWNARSQWRDQIFTGATAKNKKDSQGSLSQILIQDLWVERLPAPATCLALCLVHILAFH